MREKSSYSIGNEDFSNKECIRDRCRIILANTTDNQPVTDLELKFLVNLFSHHDGWVEKSSKGIRKIIAQKNIYGTRGFVLILSDNTSVDISFMHALKCLRGERTRPLLPQKLIDFKNAARAAVTADIRAFRDTYLALNIFCPISGEPITRNNCEVDHEPPLTFDSLLYDFTNTEQINPLEISVGSKNGTIPFFESQEIATKWIDYHRINAKLRLLSIVGHAQVSSARIDWKPLINPAN